MTPFVFDTLGASKQLREAGMPEGMAEAVVSVFQHAATMPDISHLATKADLEGLSVATKADVASMATSSDLELLRVGTKADLEVLSAATSAEIKTLRKEMATKEDLAQVRLEVANMRADLQATIRQQGWLIVGGVGAVVTISNTLLKVFS